MSPHPAMALDRRDPAVAALIPPRLRRFSLGAIALCLTSAFAAQSQTTQPAPQAPALADPGPLATLHVYVSLEQMPVLVLSPLREPMKPFPESAFLLSIEGGTPFRPTHVRREGDDAVSLAILIDTTQPRLDLLNGVEDAIATLGAGSLRPQDRVSLYAMDCTLVQSRADLPPNSATLRLAAAAVMKPFRDRMAQPHADRCKPSLPLWDSLAQVTAQLWQRRGRRVLIAITEGKDHGSRNTWKTVMEVTQATSTSIFPVITAPISLIGRNELDPGQRLVHSARLKDANGFEDPFNYVTELSGGIATTASHKNLGRSLQHILQMVRERYIVEFPRADAVGPGNHSIEVTLTGTSAFIRSAGVTAPLADPKLKADALTLPPGEQATPVPLVERAPEDGKPAPNPIPAPIPAPAAPAPQIPQA